MDGIVKDEVGQEEGTADDDRRDGRGSVVVGGGYAKWTPVGLPRQNRVLCVGRICEEAHGGRLAQPGVGATRGIARAFHGIDDRARPFGPARERRWRRGRPR